MIIWEHKGFKMQDEKGYPIQENTKLNIKIILRMVLY